MNEPELTHCTRDTFDGKKWHHVEFSFMAAPCTIWDAALIVWAERRAELRGKRADNDPSYSR